MILRCLDIIYDDPNLHPGSSRKKINFMKLFPTQKPKLKQEVTEFNAIKHRQSIKLEPFHKAEVLSNAP